MTKDYDRENLIDSPLREIWKESYPIAYWDNRIKKINQYNTQDEMEAVFTLLQLVDTYVHIFSAKIRNPDAPWYMVKERTYKHDIDRTLEVFAIDCEGREEAYTDLTLFNGDPEQLLGIQLHGDWKEKYEPLDFLAVDVLGCPAEIDKENTEIRYLDDRENYLKIVNGVINFWREHVKLLNDLKHGFRLLPFNWDTLKSLIDEDLVRVSNYDMDALKEEYEEAQDSHVYFWRLEVKETPKDVTFDEMEPGDEEQVGLQLAVYRIDFEKCVKFSRITLRLLHNLLGRGGNIPVNETMGAMLEGDLQSVERGDIVAIQMFDSVMKGDIVYGIKEESERKEGG